MRPWTAAHRLAWDQLDRLQQAGFDKGDPSLSERLRSTPEFAEAFAWDYAALVQEGCRA